jgi:hypothetical protein
MRREILFLVLIITLVSISALGLGQNCLKALIVSISSTDPISLDGFDVMIDGEFMDTTRNGVVMIDLSEFSAGRHTITASKDEGEHRYGGHQEINIPCINASRGGKKTVQISVKSY